MKPEHEKLLQEAEEVYFQKENTPDARAAFHAAIRVGFLLQDKDEIKRATFLVALVEHANAMSRILNILREPKYQHHFENIFLEDVNAIWKNWIEFVKKEQNNGII